MTIQNTIRNFCGRPRLNSGVKKNYQHPFKKTPQYTWRVTNNGRMLFIRHEFSLGKSTTKADLLEIFNKLDDAVQGEVIKIVITGHEAAGLWSTENLTLSDLNRALESEDETTILGFVEFKQRFIALGIRDRSDQLQGVQFQLRNNSIIKPAYAST